MLDECTDSLWRQEKAPVAVIGNQFGKNVLAFYPDQLTPRDISAFVENECNMEIDPTRRILHFDLKSEELNSTQHYELPLQRNL